MERLVTAHLEAYVIEPAEIVLAVAVADGPFRSFDSLLVNVDEVQIPVRELAGPHGTRLHTARVPRGYMVIDYAATVNGFAPPPTVEPIDLVTYLRPSRYCESDRMAAVAMAQFEGLTGRDLVDGVSSWVGRNVGYVPGSSRPIDGAVATLLGREGVCRDFAHLTIALLRACDTPARIVSVYAPGLSPMDFHAVVEAYVEGAWHVVDATLLAPRSSLLRIATGRDAADIAFLSSTRGAISLVGLGVSATVSPDLPDDDIRALAVLA